MTNELLNLCREALESCRKMSTLNSRDTHRYDEEKVAKALAAISAESVIRNLSVEGERHYSEVIKTEIERKAFEQGYPYLDKTMHKDAWGRDKYKHEFVQAIWDEWIKRAALSAQPVAQRDREADRARFTDELFNRWLDEGISDAGHTVWDQIEDVCSAWHGWENSRFYQSDDERQSLNLPPIDGYQYNSYSAEHVANVLENVVKPMSVTKIDEERTITCYKICTCWDKPQAQKEQQESKPFAYFQKHPITGIWEEVHASAAGQEGVVAAYKEPQAPKEQDMDADIGLHKLTLIDCQHLFWLAARDIVFFSTYDEKIENWTNYWTVAVNCNDTFYYASADATSCEISDVADLRRLYEQYGFSGIVAWCSIKRNEMPLKQLQTQEFQLAYAAMKEQK